jgi:hypothetical protein
LKTSKEIFDHHTGVASNVYAGGSAGGYAGNLYEKMKLWLNPMADQTIPKSVQTAETYDTLLPMMFS